MFRDPGIDLSTKPIIEQMQQLNMQLNLYIATKPIIEQMQQLNLKLNLKPIIEQMQQLNLQLNLNQNDDLPSLDSLSGPPLDSLLFHLRNDEDCEDLNKFAMVSPYFRTEAKLFMKGADNRPGIKKMTLLRDPIGSGRFRLDIHLYLSNIPFYDLTSLDWERFGRFEWNEETNEAEEAYGAVDSLYPVLRVSLSGIKDPAIEQLANLLSSAIHEVEIEFGSSCLSQEYFPMAEQLLRNATIGDLTFWNSFINDSTAPIIIDIVSHLKRNSNELYLDVTNKTGLSDPESFVTSLCEGVTSLRLDDYNLPFFGLPNSFWEKYLNAKLSSGSVGWVYLNSAVKFTEAPISINPKRRLDRVEWGQPNDF